MTRRQKNDTVLAYDRYGLVAPGLPDGVYRLSDFDNWVDQPASAVWTSWSDPEGAHAFDVAHKEVYYALARLRGVIGRKKRKRLRP